MEPSDTAKRLLVEAEGYIALELFDEAAERIEAVSGAGLFPFECAVLRGESLRERDRLDEAVPFFRQALQLKPGDVAATVGFGWCAKRLGQTDLAIAAYEAALERHPDVALLHYNLACYQSLLGQADEALAHLRSAIEKEKAFREAAASEEDFAGIRHLPAFRRLLKPPPEG